MNKWVINNLGNILTSLSILLALITWLITFLRDRKIRKMNLTALTVANISTNERLAEANFQMAILINENKKIDVENLDITVERHIIDLLDYYEYLCELFHCNILDKNTVIHIRGGAILKTYKLCDDYIFAIRKKQNRPQLYSQFEQFAIEMEDIVNMSASDKLHRTA